MLRLDFLIILWGILHLLFAVTLGTKSNREAFILDKNIGGLDSGFSLDKKEFEEMIKSC